MLDELARLLEGKILPSPSEEDLAKYRKWALERIKAGIPPGTEDTKKPDGGVGDALIWKEVINLAKTEKSPIVFVSDDQKEDWVLEVEGKKICALPALRQELITETGQDFQIYAVPRFLSYVKKTESPELSEESIEEAATVRDQRVATVEARDLAEFLEAVPIQEDYSAGAHRIWRSLKNMNPSIAATKYEMARVKANLVAVTKEITRVENAMTLGPEFSTAKEASDATLSEADDPPALFRFYSEQTTKLDGLRRLRHQLENQLAEILARRKESE
ncbi:PIN-like domain-containing protein [Paraburkholderia sp. WSM4175]|uniref:PIN-like domain-containing protein n=1 Tax=Paraburkholderia sp. WSM4175 TaxID=2991072 RepID=UPI003D1C3B79